MTGQRLLSQTRLLLIALFLFGTQIAVADDAKAFTSERFEALQAEDAVILVDVWASWCSTCRAQGKVLDKLLAEEGFEEVHKLRLDWDEQKDHAETLNAWRQSTLIVYKGDKEMARVVAETREPALRNLLEAAL